MELCGALAFVPLCLLLTACDSGLIPSSTKALTRSRATELILKGTHPQTIYTWVQTGNILIYGDCDSEIWNLDGLDGLIFISRRQQNMDLGYGGYVTQQMTTVNLTPKGKSYALSSKEIDSGFHSEGQVPIKLCERQFDQVTGITLAAQNQAQVVYAWKTANVTPFGKHRLDIAARGRQCTNGGGNTGGPEECRVASGVSTALFILYDDGWRFAQ